MVGSRRGPPHRSTNPFPQQLALEIARRLAWQAAAVGSLTRSFRTGVPGSFAAAPVDTAAEEIIEHATGLER